MNLVSKDGVPVRLTDELDMPVSPPAPESADLIRRLAESFDGKRERVVDAAEIDQLLAGRVSDFRLRALKAINDIPRGQTRTYGQLASDMGSPKAARAVGSACASNPLPLIIPCHRVVPASGLGRYSGPGGEASKRLLLEMEGAL
jgi:methylated-DNA-[protein]-cysteine S-methyltransferase